ncbi:MAG: DMT family transporter [Octadecabacter sp.]
MMQISLITLGIVILAGCATALQAPMNAALSRDIGGGIPAAAISFGVGFFALTALSFVTKQGHAFAEIPNASPILLTGGVLGAFYVWAILWSIPTLGALTTFAAIILGQMVAAILLDATGLFGLAVQSVTPLRIAAAGLVGAGVILSRL